MPRSFRGSESVLLRRCEGSDKVVLFFGGGKGGMGIGMTPFEFLNLTDGANTNRIFFKDVDFSFYHRGLKGHTVGLDDTQEFVQGLVEELGGKRVVTVGNSAGGFGAILFGARLGAEMVHAFSPVTRIRLLPRILDRDPRNLLSDLRFYLTYRGDKVEDLNDIGLGKCKGTAFFVHYCRGSRLDSLHAKLLRPSRNIKRLEYPCSDHRVARYLKDRDYLLRLIDADTPQVVEDIYTQVMERAKKGRTNPLI